jgi:hypothetical protein
VDAQARGSSRGGKRVNERQAFNKKRGKDVSLGGGNGPYIIAALFLLVILPPIASFIMNVYRDPLTPQLIKDSYAAVKERTMGYLSSRGSNKKKKNKAENRLA